MPTQILAELLKAEGYDRNGYRSSLGPSHNIALFDLYVADLIPCLLFSVKDISFKFEQVPNSYRVKDHIGNKEAGGPLINTTRQVAYRSGIC